MRISDWSSDVCSSDLLEHVGNVVADEHVVHHRALPAHARGNQARGRQQHDDRADMGDDAAALVQEQVEHQQRERALLNPNLLGVDKSYRSEEHTSELQSLMRISYAVFCLKKKKKHKQKK